MCHFLTIFPPATLSHTPKNKKNKKIITARLTAFSTSSSRLFIASSKPRPALPERGTHVLCCGSGCAAVDMEDQFVLRLPPRLCEPLRHAARGGYVAGELAITPTGACGLT